MFSFENKILKNYANTTPIIYANTYDIIPQIGKVYTHALQIPKNFL